MSRYSFTIPHKAVSNINQSITNKIDKIKELINRLGKDPTLMNLIQTTEEKYSIITVTSLSDFNNEIEGADEVFFNTLLSQNTDGELDKCVNACIDYYNKNKHNIDSMPIINKLLDEISNIHLGIDVESINYEYCCGQIMRKYPESSHLHCEICSRDIDIKGMVFEDAQFYSQEGKKTKHGKYDPIRTYIKWLDDISACSNNVNIPKHVMDKISEVVSRDYKGEPGKTSGLNINIIRNILKECKLTTYNRHAAYILAVFSGKYPPTFTVSDRDRITTYYQKAIMEHKELKNIEHDFSKKDNNPYCPFFIMKIIEALWFDDKEKMRIFKYIHMKKPTTLMKQDNFWATICKKIELPYKATDFTMFID